jgi:hypothetical protein
MKVDVQIQSEDPWGLAQIELPILIIKTNQGLL